MKLYKIDFTNTIGDYMVTVPTDSQFLIGIGNGDATATAQLFDGESEITAENEKIGEYTCFRFETNGTPSRKKYKAVINGNNFETKDLWFVPFDEVDYQGYTSIWLVLPESINPEDLNYDNENKLASFQAYVYGVDFSVSPRSITYLKTITLTWNASKNAYEIPEDFGNNVVKYLQFADCTETYIYFGYGWEASNESDGEYDDKTSVGVPNPYTQNIDLLVICQKMSVAYRDFEGDVPSGEALVDAILDDDEATDELKAKMQVDAPLQITAPNASTQTIVITKDNFADIANKVWVVGTDSTADNIKNIILEINRTAFPSGTNYWRFLVSYKFPTDYHYMRYLTAMQGAFKIKDGDKIYKINNVHQYQNPNGNVIFPQTDMGGQTLTYEFLWDETLVASENSKFMAGRLVNATVDMSGYI